MMSLMTRLRDNFHRRICREVLGLRPRKEGYNIADSGSEISKELAERIVSKINAPICRALPQAQMVGTKFTEAVCDFLELAFNRIRHLRPGNWHFRATALERANASFDQYEHLSEFFELFDARKNPEAALGMDYLLKPDIVVSREPLSDDEINGRLAVVGASEKVGRLTPLRKCNREKSTLILHASISCKWTMRSDRAQNTRTEALNLIRNRKGRTPIIAAVTFEPLPTRLASIAMGTGDVDCTYHAAFFELKKAVQDSGNEDQIDMLNTLVDGRRLRDISDLPFDLAS